MASLSFYDRQHIQKILIQQNSISSIFNTFILQVSPFLSKWQERNTANVWLRNQSIENNIDKAIEQLQSSLLANISSFQIDAWKRSDMKNEDFIKQYIKGMAINANVKQGMFSRNADALDVLAKGIDARGNDLSSAVWKIGDTAKTQLEFYLKSGLSEGRPTNIIGGDVRQILNNPGKRFHRIRDKKTGNLVMSQPMKDYHPGQGVYRSAKMNALRLTATTTNTAYRSADYDRWSKQDFVLGIQIQRSANNRGPCVVCDSMVGEYPKTFKFTGFHPFCICFAIPIVMRPEDLADYLLDDIIPEGQVIKTIPTQAQSFVEDNKTAVSGSYWYLDNFTRNGKLISDEANRIKDGVLKATAPRIKSIYTAFEPFSPIIIEKLQSLKINKQRQAFLQEVIENESFEKLDLGLMGEASTYRHPLHRGKGESLDWQRTKAMARNINESGIDVYFLPEYKDLSSADAITKINGEWKVVDFKYSVSTKANTLQENISKGFSQAGNVVIKLDKADRGHFRECTEYLKRKGVYIGSMKIINKNGKCIDFSRKDLLNGKYDKILKGFL